MAPANPYVGPKPFEKGQELFGRNRAAAELRYLLTSERIVLLYAPSGAGKSSLIQAALIPRLEERFDIWGPARVNRIPPAGAANRYVWSVISSLEGSDMSECTTLREYAAQRPREHNPLIIIDQFEEILRVDPNDGPAKKVFFENLGDLLCDPAIWALLVLREDYLAPLDPYSRLVPTHLQNRFRIDRLTREEATQAIEGPTAKTDRKYADKVVQILVDDLATVGEYVEPLQLQVACFDLWERMNLWERQNPDQPPRLLIEADDIGDISGALKNYYDNAVRTTAGDDDSVERDIRDWFQNQLITADGVRNQVRHEAQSSGGLDNNLVESLLDTYLVRAESRSGTSWYELSHDRLVVPVRASNAEWLDRHLNKNAYADSLRAVLDRAPTLSERTLREWFSAHLIPSDKTSGKVYRGESETEDLPNAAVDVLCSRYILRADSRPDGVWYELADTRLVKPILADNLEWRAGYRNPVADAYERWLGGGSSSEKLLSGVLLTEASDFESKNAAEVYPRERAFLETSRVEDRRARRRRRIIWTAITSTLIVLTALTAWAWREERNAESEARIARNNELIAKSREYAAQAETLFSTGNRESALDRAMKALDIAGTDEARAAVAHAFPQVAATLSHKAAVNTAAFSPDGQRIVTASDDKTAIIWSASTAQKLATLKGHAAGVKTVAFSPDGRSVVSASDDMTAKVWDAFTGKLVWTLKGHTDRVNSAGFSQDGNYIVTASDDMTAKVWYAATGKLTWTLEGHSDKVNRAEFSPDGKYIVTASDDMTAKVWDVSSGQPVKKLDHEGPVNSAMFSRDGQRIVTASDDKTARVWNAASGKLVAALGHKGQVFSAVFSRDGQRILTASDDFLATLWNATGGPSVKKLNNPVEGTGQVALISSAAFSQDGRYIITATGGKTARVWNAASGRMVASLEGHKDVVWRAAFSPDGQRIITASLDNTARLWNLASGRLVATLNGHNDQVLRAAFSPDSRRIVTTSLDTTARLWDVATGQSLATLNGHKGQVYSPGFSPDGKFIVTASSDGTAKVWSAFGGPALATLDAHSVVYNAAFSPQGKLIVVTANVDGTATVWNPAGGPPLATLKGHQGPVVRAVFSPDGQRIVTASADGKAMIWNPAGGPPVATLAGHTATISNVAFSPDGKRMVTASLDKTAMVWNVSGGASPVTLRGSQGPLGSAEFSRDGQRIVTAGSDNNNEKVARLWNAASGQLLATLEGHSAAVNSAAFSPDGQYIVTASKDYTARVWNAVSGKPVAKLEGHLNAVNRGLFSPDSRFVATVSADKTVRIHRIVTLDEINRILR